eukprot:2864028-Prymnesium_polylepis.1
MYGALQELLSYEDQFKQARAEACARACVLCAGCASRSAAGAQTHRRTFAAQPPRARSIPEGNLGRSQ